MGHFADGTFRRLDILPTGIFANNTFFRRGILPPVWFLFILSLTVVKNKIQAFKNNVAFVQNTKTC